MRFSREHYQEMIDHARAEAPDECCGMVAGRDDEAVRVFRATNIEHSQLRFMIDPKEQLRIDQEIEADGLELTAIYHSHTRTEPRPSETDIIFAKLWPGVLWVIVGLAGENPDVRLWRIDDGQAAEAELVVE
jgi:[CysO sulfur-carrier protein]-S-L-cysteine hydrolase